MKFLSKLTSWMWCRRTVSLVSSIITYIKDYGYVSDTLYSDEFALVLKRYLKVNIKKDWIGRLYGVINPIIDINGKLDINNTIFEFDGDNTNNDEQVKYYIYKQMSLISDLFKINRLYDYISCDISRIDEFDNFLIVFDITSRAEMSRVFKGWWVHTLIYVALALGILFIIF